MPTLTASPRARLAAVQRGLAVPQIEANRTPVSEVRTPDMPTEVKSPDCGELAEPKPVVRSPDDHPAVPSNKQRKRAEFLQRQRAARDHLWPLLSARFPLVFKLPAPPLAIGIHKAILEATAAAADEVDPRELSRFLRFWTTRWSYLRVVHRGEERCNLDGSAVGAPTVAERNDAGRRLWDERYQEIQDAEVKEAAPA